jgi:hypothetical protein
MTVSGSPGTGTVTLSAAVTGFLSFANAGAVDSKTYTYALREGNKREVCRGVYTASGTTLTRVTLRSTNATPTNPESFTSAAIVAGVAAAEDINAVGFHATLPSNQTGIVAITDTKLNFTTELFDIGGFYDAANAKWTPQAGLITIQSGVAALGSMIAGDRSFVRIYKNGALWKQNSMFQAITTSTIPVNPIIGVIDLANGTDYYECFVNMALGGGGTGQCNANQANFFSGAWLGGTP